MLEFISQPWPWYVAGPLIGLVIPLLLIIGNKSFGISSSLRHACAACLPSKVPFFQYDWKKEMWNFFFVGGVLTGGIIAGIILSNPAPVDVDPALVAELESYGITNFNNLLPMEIFTWDSLLSLKGLLIIILGGFAVGFGARYAGGCTSGHAIMGISNLQLSSVIATVSFMIGGFITANIILPFILNF